MNATGGDRPTIFNWNGELEDEAEDDLVVPCLERTQNSGVYALSFSFHPGYEIRCYISRKSLEMLAESALRFLRDTK